MLSRVSEKFNINSNWLILNQEEMFLTPKDTSLVNRSGKANFKENL